ncbi:MAG: autotransporter-associated beta strand repeat-containing protein, partial [bacterium]
MKFMQMLETARGFGKQCAPGGATLLAVAAMTLAAGGARADQTASWTNSAAGNWSAGGNWDGGIAATGTTGVAYFTNAITGNRTVTVNATPWTINGLVFGNTGAYGFTVASGTLNLAGTTPTITVNAGSTGTVSSILSSSAGAGLVKEGAGKLTLNGQWNSYTGDTINGGVLEFWSNSFEYIYSGGTIYINNGSTLSITGGRCDFGNKTFAFGSTGGGTITVGAGVNWVTRVANTFRTTGGAQNLITGVAGLNLNNLGVNFDVARGTDPASDLTVSSGVWGPGTGTFTKTGNGILTLSGVNSFAGPITLSAGTLKISGSGKLGDTGPYAANMANNAAFVYNSSAAQTLSGSISGTGTVTQAGSGMLTLSGANTYSGATVVTNGTLKIDGSGKLGGGTYTANLANDALFLYNSSATQTLSGAISGSGAVTQTGSGMLTLGGTNTYSGPTAVSNGTLLVNGSLGNGAVTVASGGLGGSGTIGGAVTVNSGARLYAGTDGGTGTNTLGSTLTLQAGALCYLDVGVTSSASNDLISVAGTVELNSTVFHIKAPNTSVNLETNTDYVLISGASVAGEPNRIPVFDVAPLNFGFFRVLTNGNNVVLHYDSRVLLATGSVNPSTVTHNQSALVTVTVTPLSTPITSVTLDTTAIGGPAALPLSLATGTDYTNTVTVGAGIGFGVKTLIVTVKDDEGFEGSAFLTLTVVVGSQVWNGAGA